MNPRTLGPAWRKSSYSRRADDCVEAAWRKSSYSRDSNACVEAAWRKSSYSRRQNDCVEAAADPGTVYLRDSKLGDASPVLSFTPTAWAAFLTAAKTDEFTR